MRTRALPQQRQSCPSGLLRFAVCAAFLLTGLTGCASMGGGGASRPLRSVEHVDLPRYMGDWFVVANIPYFAEKDCHDSVESYALRPDGGIDNRFACREDSFDAPMTQKLSTVASVYDKRTNAEWRVPFFKVLRIQYFVIDLDPEYQWAVIGHPSRRYGWVLSRTRTLPQPTYAGILERLRSQGYDTSQFVIVPHRAPATASTP